MVIKMDYSVHVGFGFHVNCYHSYRGDTDDELGFGGDIRIIRNTIAVLNHWNQQGIPVKGTWDFENAYSLEEILPCYAPDIIKDVKVRVRQFGDENILMGYNNGAMSAMTEDEFMASVQWAVSNPKGSGLGDIFGACQPIIRPQEVMFTPAQASLYQKAGVEGICLYYSCIPFDAFRTLIPELTQKEALNPLNYQYGEEQNHITVIPMYSQADILDMGSLRRWVVQLHKKQEMGQIDGDVFLFINMDADSFLWEPFPIPHFMHKISCFGGLDGLIREIADLPFVIFDTPYHYMKTHETVGSISFGEDVADGNFSGFSSWAEKPFNRQIWTRLEQARMYARLYDLGEAPSFEERVRLLSTTHFGLASPVLNLTRERTALALSEKMMGKEETALCRRWEQKKHKVREHEIWLKNVNESSLIQLQIRLEMGFCQDISCLKVKGKHLRHYIAVPFAKWEDGSVRGVWLLCRFDRVRRKYRLHFKNKKHPQERIQQTELRDMQGFGVQTDLQTALPVLCSDEDNVIATWNSRLCYGEEVIRFETPVWEACAYAGEGNGICAKGEIHIPGEAEPGYYEFKFCTMEGEKGIFLISRVRYPYTMEKNQAASKAFNLGRYFDKNWKEAIPMELTLELGDDAKVGKRDFMGNRSEYPLADFWRSYPQNTNMDSFNHHMTGGVLQVYDGQKGLLLAHARQILGSMAHCPMRLGTGRNGKHRLSLNPFGTYDGKQRFYPSAGNGCIMDLYQAVMPQAKSLAPAYNGVEEFSVQMLSGYEKMNAQKMDDLYRDMAAFADGCVVYATNGAISRWTEDNVVLHEHEESRANPDRLLLTGVLGNGNVSLVKSVIRFLNHKLKSL